MDSNNLYDLIYIDGNHDYDSMNRDIENFKHKVKKGGYISGHDFNSNTGDVEIAVRNHFPDKEISIFSDSSWLIKM
jgi:predicted phosphodiesterase